MHPSQLRISDFSYPLPEEKIAKYPLEQRDQSKLLIYKEDRIGEDIYRNLHNHIPENSLLVFNNTKVIQARLLFTNDHGAEIEVFCLEPLLDYALAMASTSSVRWKCMVGRAAKWKQKTINLVNNHISLSAEVIERQSDTFIIEFKWKPEGLSFAEVLDLSGILPIPPYLKRETEQIDIARYQTVYAKEKGSVAAPTAGLHFTEEVIRSLKEKGVLIEEVTLHVGAGTFKPVKSETMQGHDMHAELMQVDAKTVNSLLSCMKSGRPVIVVGTTSLRTVESLYWQGVVALKEDSNPENDFSLGQWYPYDADSSSLPDSMTALEALMRKMTLLNTTTISCKTQIIIAPPYQLRIADALITNFHQPNSTLLLLVAAVTGENWRKIYDYALNHEFRFLSYGDGSLLWKQPAATSI